MNIGEFSVEHHTRFDPKSGLDVRYTDCFYTDAQGQPMSASLPGTLTAPQARATLVAKESLMARFGGTER